MRHWAGKWLEIDNKENYAIRILGRTAFEYCDHYLISFTLDRCKTASRSDLIRNRITIHNLSDCSGMSYSIERMRKYLLDQSDKVSGYIYYTSDYKAVSYIWVMRKGGDEFQYRVRNIEALGFDFCVHVSYRGQGIVRLMIYDLLCDLQQEGVHELFSSVRVNNNSALRAYKKCGMKVVARKRFFRIGGIRIPYPII